jgi:hypothetical protein
MKVHSLMSMLLAISAACSCGTAPANSGRLSADFKTEGFLDPDHYQVVVTGTPASGLGGLVETRESAREDALKKLDSAVLASLSDYCIDNRIKALGLTGRDQVLNLPAARAELQAGLTRFLKYGRTAFEYYNEDHSAVIVFRIGKKGLLNAIESIQVNLVAAGGKG